MNIEGDTGTQRHAGANQGWRDCGASWEMAEAAPGKAAGSGDDKPGAAPLTSLPAAGVHAYFAAKLGPTEDAAYEAMRLRNVEELEALQIEAEDVANVGLDAEAQMAGQQWSVRIGAFIA